jgi:hypothetical protein
MASINEQKASALSRITSMKKWDGISDKCYDAARKIIHMLKKPIKNWDWINTYDGSIFLPMDYDPISENVNGFVIKVNSDGKLSFLTTREYMLMENCLER